MFSSWVKEETTTTGTGTLTLSAVSNFVRFSAAFSEGDYVQYVILTSDSKYEAGIGKVAASNTLERSEILETYDGTTYDNTSPTALTLVSGTHTVICTNAGTATPYAAINGVLDADSIGSKFIVSASKLSNQNSNYTPVNERIYAFPFLLLTRATISEIGVYVAAASTSGTIEVGIYNINASGLPERRLCVATSIDTSSTGLATGSTTAITLNPGIYAACLVTATDNPTIRGSSDTVIVPGFGISSSGVNVNGLRRDAAATTLPAAMAQTSWVDADVGSAETPYIYIGV